MVRYDKRDLSYIIVDQRPPSERLKPREIHVAKMSLRTFISSELSLLETPVKRKKAISSGGNRTTSPLPMYILAGMGYLCGAVSLPLLILTINTLSGRTMLAQRLATILPALSLEESLETTRIYSVVGLRRKDQALLATRLVRARTTRPADRP